MVITSTLAFVVFWKVWKWPLALVGLVLVPLMLLEFVFLGSNLLKVLDGGYVPLGFAGVLAFLMWTWIRGTRIVYDKAHRESVPLDDLLVMLAKSHPSTARGTAIYLTSDPDMAPAALLHNLKHNSVLHEKNIVVTVRTANVPWVADEDRLAITEMPDSFTRITMTFGYSEEPNVPRGLSLAKKKGLKFEIMSTSFFLSRRSFKASSNYGMPVWQDRIYIAMARSAADATGFYRLPANRVVELGQQFAI
jgi:KUP system potassium uptake protein